MRKTLVFIGTTVLVSTLSAQPADQAAIEEPGLRDESGLFSSGGIGKWGESGARCRIAAFERKLLTRDPRFR